MFKSKKRESLKFSHKKKKRKEKKKRRKERMNYDSLFDSDMSPDLTADMGYQNESGADTETMGSVAASSIFQGRMDRASGMNGMGGAMTASNGEFRTNDDTVKPHILMFGLKRSGKSSILKVVFNKMDPINTRQLESTKGLDKSSKEQ